MPRLCQRCERKPLPAVSRSHSNMATKRRQFLNLQWKRVDGLRLRLCTRCLKTMAKKGLAS
ncbi:50S ribosomal protein L28 [Candidatus Uhrbacteria bacterium]|nr:50S ribosomal protein L28 [Candidatus Uhrbacteria bacterium]